MASGSNFEEAARIAERYRPVVRAREGLRAWLRGLIFTCLLCSAVIAFWLATKDNAVAWETEVFTGFYVGLPLGSVVWVGWKIVRFAFRR